MREAIARAEVGDDVYGEDPATNELEAETASRLGKEAALFVPSGTMANQIALRTGTRPGDVVLVGESAHVLLWEAGAASALSGLQLQTIGRGGWFGADDLVAAVHPDEQHYAPTRLVAVENTHNASGGRVVPLDVVREVAAAAREHGLGLHLDGARLWNAAIATGREVAELAEPFDTVAVCLSKGLGAPLGSLVCGPRERIAEARRARKLLGGGMRQTGLMAAAGLHALRHHVARLADDHRRARRLADGLRALDVVVLAEPETNMVLFEVDDLARFLAETRKRGVLVNPIRPGVLRAVTHLDLSDEDVEDALGRMAECLGREPRVATRA